MLSRKMAEFVLRARAGAMPEEALALALDGITDSIGCLFAGSTEPLAGYAALLVPRVGASQGGLIAACPVLGGYTSAQDAAFYGATLSHALDYDDVSYPGLTHPSTILAPALLAAAALQPERTGRDLLFAYVCGVELLGKLGGLLNPDLFERGWHPTPTLGPPVVAYAAATFLGLSYAEIVAALGIAASASAGLRANFGTMTKPLHAGQASRAGLSAAILARAGFTASADVFEHSYGYFACFGSPDLAASAMPVPGEPLEILSARGLEIKPYPACAAGQPAIEAGLALHARVAGRAIRRVIVRTGAPTMMPMIHDRPREPLHGKFSLPYCVAVALVTGKVTIDSFSAEALDDAAVGSMMDRISVEIDSDARDDFHFGVRIELHLEDGHILVESVARAKGTISRRLSETELAAKFDDCTSKVIEAGQSRRVWNACRALTDSTLPVELSAMLANAGSTPK